MTDISRYWFQRFKIWEKYDKGIWMTEDAWFGVTPEPIAKYITPHPHTIFFLNILKQDRSAHRRIRAQGKDRHRRCFRRRRRQRHRPSTLGSLGARLRHRERSQDAQVRKAQR
jgi:hypothetical protein